MMKSACYSILALVFCLAENIVLAKPKTPDYSNMTATTESESKGPVDFGQAYRGILNKVPCNVGNIIDAMVNVNIPATKQEMENNGEFYQVAESESIFHNFREGVLSATSSRDEVSRTMGRAVAEYWLEKAGILSKSEWRVLDPNMPNVKYISKDGGREAVYNQHTGQKVDSGINAGTANVADGPLDFEHWYSNSGGDIGRFTRCKTSNELQKTLAKFLVEHPELIPAALTRETFLHETAEQPKRQSSPVQGRPLTLDDVCEALKEDGSGAQKAVEALR